MESHTWYVLKGGVNFSKYSNANSLSNQVWSYPMKIRIVDNAYCQTVCNTPVTEDKLYHLPLDIFTIRTPKMSFSDFAHKSSSHFTSLVNLLLFSFA